MVFKAVGKVIASFFRSFDLLTRKRDTYPTCLGGLLTIVMFSMMGFYVFLKLGDPIRVIETTIDSDASNSTTVDPIGTPIDVINTTMVNHYLRHRDPIDNSTVHYVGGSSGKFSFGMYWYASTYDSSLAHHEFWRQSSSGWNLYPLETCSTSNHPYHDTTAFNTRYTGDGVCPAVTYMYLSGDDYSSSFNMFELDLCGCYSGGCSSAADIQYDVDYSTIDMYYLSGYYDYDATPSNPVSTKQIFEEGETFYGFQKYYRVSVRENIVIYLNGTTETFYSLGDKQLVYKKSTTTFFKIKFKLDNMVEVYEQYVLSEVDTSRRMLLNTTTAVTTSVDESIEVIYFYSVIIAHIGGIYACFHFIMSCIIAPYERKIFLHDQLNQYHKIKNSSANPADIQQGKSFGMVNPYNQPDSKNLHKSKIVL